MATRLTSVGGPKGLRPRRHFGTGTSQTVGYPTVWGAALLSLAPGKAGAGSRHSSLLLAVSLEG
jgi:hypothetical protein